MASSSSQPRTPERLKSEEYIATHVEAEDPNDEDEKRLTRRILLKTDTRWVHTPLRPFHCLSYSL